VLWTNRLPAAFLEGEEDLIQDPHKLHDEVRGRKEMFEQWRDAGIPPVCLGDRCPHCPMDLFCHSLASVLAGRAGGLPPASPDVLPLARGIAARLAGMPDTERRKTRLRAVPHEYLSEARAHDPDLSEVREIARLGVPILGLPPCLGGPAQPPPAVPRPGPEALAADGRLDLVRFTDWFVRHACRVKSLRCRKCAHREQCPGLHINQARSWGFAAMQPLEE
jgi:hypothetical protein